ncbi:CLUMA_CG018547, isoform A [Clunio marinus]|uniref:CLUMA_CG018547, isoform A n=1 Tax=Clunio marinus TaxID=568069 RepID=A0A1J1J1C9_9DIPT|nr:CLUMA_CG018547, isoform A [Clunio marinus]
MEVFISLLIGMLTFFVVFVCCITCIFKVCPLDENEDLHSENQNETNHELGMNTNEHQTQPSPSAPSFERVLSVPIAYDEIDIHSTPYNSTRQTNSSEELPPSYNEALGR